MTNTAAIEHAMPQPEGPDGTERETIALRASTVRRAKDRARVKLLRAIDAMADTEALHRQDDDGGPSNAT